MTFAKKGHAGVPDFRRYGNESTFRRNGQLNLCIQKHNTISYVLSVSSSRALTRTRRTYRAPKQKQTSHTNKHGYTHAPAQTTFTSNKHPPTLTETSDTPRESVWTRDGGGESRSSSWRAFTTQTYQPKVASTSLNESNHGVNEVGRRRKTTRSVLCEGGNGSEVGRGWWGAAIIVLVPGYPWRTTT